MRILVTGGAGYIGSHTCLTLLQNGHDVIVFDNLSNSSIVAIKRVEELTGKHITFYNGDMRDTKFLQELFEKETFDAVIHFAGLKAVGESVQKPLLYYDNNIIGSIKLFELMYKHNVKTLIFSSSATVYGIPKSVPITESMPKGELTNPYGRTKSMIEDILMDMQAAGEIENVIILRYFNPIGAHESGMIGEDPKGIPNNLLPYIAQVAVGKRDCLSVWGNDYNTVDGTGVRDYIHVMDLSIGHVMALEKFIESTGYRVYNLGTGKGTSVLEMIKAFEKASGRIIKYKICERRPGDIAINYADPLKAYAEFGFKTKYDIDKMCLDTWNWQKNNPNGYEE